MIIRGEKEKKSGFRNKKRKVRVKRGWEGKETQDVDSLCTARSQRGKRRTFGGLRTHLKKREENQPSKLDLG